MSEFGFPKDPNNSTVPKSLLPRSWEFTLAESILASAVGPSGYDWLMLIALFTSAMTASSESFELFTDIAYPKKTIAIARINTKISINFDLLLCGIIFSKIVNVRE